MHTIVTKSKSVLQWGLFGLAFLFSSACQSIDKSQAEVKMPGGAAVGIFVGEDAKIAVVDKDGNRIPPCQLCTVELEGKYGKACADAPKDMNLCDGVTGATVQDIDSIVILRSHKNPHCMTMKVGGTTYTIPNPCR